ncbi:DUF1634 domain-containing protein [Enterobacter hormaechei]|uniref:DUF1634 domain-containing protein n=1 Tax=Enterobacter hormaechei TaxID=158836 RepID=UPI000BA0D7E4|nr:DUF1634 domain-containing protein [Enterobacter hormaechei]EIQ7173213.1 DUF1634 domain-containing protein [Escherichia coli]MBT1725468.1 DUF1634 domain-containing protein [Enterobacter hormaechei subsp. hoffmannii]EIQ9904905.1 DUF1634 domain-containing protein [Escherichia coli]MCL8116512.1 DUF1634 domain-containing protein [Enterobacter hormaechei]MCM8212693.1 DUF1634 domain-containing protein [Enterobacter hormaechei]
MKSTTDNFERREQIIAALLWYGTWLASAIIAVGMALDALRPFEGSLNVGFSSYDIVKAGVALFILLPVARVALMLAIFLRERDFAYTAISALVLIIIAAGIVIEL